MPWAPDTDPDDEGPDDADLDPDSSDLLPCPECGQPLYDDTDRCPHCGRWIMPLAQHASQRSWTWTVAALIALLALVGWLLR